MTNPGRLFLTLFLFSLATPAFAIGPSDDIVELIIAAAGSAVVSLIAMVVIFIRLKNDLWPRVLISLASPLLVFPLCMAGSMATSYVVQQVNKSQNSQEAMRLEREEQEAWQRNLLRISACDGNHEVLQTQLASGQYDLTSKEKVLSECVLPRADAQALRLFVQDITAHDTEGKAHCLYLSPVLQSLNTQLLDVFVEQKLPLACPTTTAYAGDANTVAPKWWDIFEEGKAADTEQVLAVLRYLQAHGVNMKQVVEGRSLLTIAMDSNKAALILFALDAGVDPYVIPDKNNMLSPLQSWALQRFGFGDAAAYSDADRQRIQAHLRELNPKEIESLATKLNSKGGLESAKDGGVGLLAYVLHSGVNLRHLNRDRIGIMNGYTNASPELLQVLGRLNDQQLLDFICPDAVGGRDAYALYPEAIEAQNQPLLDFLKQRKMPETCPGVKQPDQSQQQ